MSARISKTYYKKPLVITYSGGKDSDVLLRLAEDCLDPLDFEVINSHTTVDAPETVYHIRDVFKKLNQKGIKTTIKKPLYKGKPTSMWKLIVENGMPPTRLARYCCRVLKETSIPNRLIATGVRSDESKNREGRDMFSVRGDHEHYYSLSHSKDVFEDALNMAKELNTPLEHENAYDCMLISKAKKNKDIIVNPIYEWTYRDIWDFIYARKIDINILYSQGFERIGCIGCPMQSFYKHESMLDRYPKYRNAYIRAFDRMIARRKEKGLPVRWKTGQECYDWWIQKGKFEVTGQITLLEYLKNKE